ncbi:MAG: hypothetical protein ABSD75_00535 [Terriglobales bacterium]|jgi:hypothetical protein
MSNEAIDVTCEGCGQTFSAFLHQMADKNSKVVCPNCRESRDCKPTKVAQAEAGTRPAKKLI